MTLSVNFSTLGTENLETTVAERTIEKAVRDYLALRAEISRVNAEAKDRVTDLKFAQRNICDYIESQRRALGVENFRTVDGTAFQAEWKRVKVANWEQFLDWLKQSDEHFHMLVKNVAKDAVLEYLSEHGIMPPGLEFEHGFEIQIRKGTK